MQTRKMEVGNGFVADGIKLEQIVTSDYEVDAMYLFQ